MYLYDSNNDVEIEKSNIKRLLTEGDRNLIKIDSFLNGTKKESYSQETSKSVLKPNPDTFQKQSEGAKGVVLNKNRLQLTFPCKGECCNFGGVDYQYCGSNCGKRGDHGGGKLQNQLDGCCFIHDDCYHKGKDHCTCDGDLITCAEKNSGPGSNTLIAFFTAKMSGICYIV